MKAWRSRMPTSRNTSPPASCGPCVARRCSSSDALTKKYLPSATQTASFRPHLHKADTPGFMCGRGTRKVTSMWLSRKSAVALAVAAAAFGWGNAAKAELKLAEVGGWVASTDGRVNGFGSHVWGDNRPKGLENLSW